MDMCFSRVRFAALETVVDAFKSSKVRVVYAATVLGFLVKPEGESGRPDQPAMVSEDTAVDVDAHSAEGSLVLPGCANTIHLGKHPAQVRRPKALTVFTHRSLHLMHRLALKSSHVTVPCDLHVDLTACLQTCCDSNHAHPA